MTKKFYFRLLITAMLGIVATGAMPVKAQQWVYLGQPGFSPSGSPHVQHTEMVINKDNELYVAFADYGYSPAGAPSGTVMKYTDTGWTPIGKPGFTPGWSNYCAMALGGGDTVYYTFADGTTTGFSRGRVMRYDGNNWDFLGDVLTVSESKFNNVVVASNGTVYYGATDRGQGGFVDGAVVVKRYTGNSWVTVGATHPASGNAKVLAGYMTMDRNDSLWIVYADQDDASKITVKKFDGTDWVTVGSSFLSGSSPNPGPQPSFIGGCDACGIHLAFDNNNTPYVVYAAVFMAAPNLTVHKFNGTAWTEVGDPYFTKAINPATTVTRGRLAFDPANNPYVTFWDQGTVNGVRDLVHVMKYDGTSWKHVGAPGFVNNTTAWHSMVIDGNGNPYVTFYDGDNNGKISVMKYTVCDAPATPSIVASSTDICRGDSVMLTISGTLNDASDWEWYEGSCGGTVIGNGDTIWVTPTDTTTYYVRGMGNCVVSGPCAAVDINVTFVPVPTFGADGDTLVSSASEGNQWYLDGEPILGATDQKYGVNQSGDYSVKVTVGPCSAQSDSEHIIPTGVGYTEYSSEIKVFPIPFDQFVRINIDENPQELKNWSLVLTDQVGRTVYSQSGLLVKNQIDLASLAPGMYLLQLKSEAGANKVYRIIKN